MAFYFFLVLVFLLFGRPQDFLPSLNPYRLTLLFSILTFAFTIITKPDYAFSRGIRIKESKRYLLFFIIMIIGIPFAYHRRVAFDFIFLKYSANILFFYLFITNIQSAQKLKKTLFMVCVSALFYACMSLTHWTYQEGRFSAGKMYDPNDFAYLFVSLFPLFFLFTRKPKRLAKRISALAGVAISIGIILLTGSRGGFLGLLVVLVYMIFSKIVIEKTGVKILFCILLGFAVFLNIDKVNIDRLQTITELSTDYNVTSETGRLDIWERALRLTASNPITGVGAGCFAMAIGYQRRDEGVHQVWQAPHNSYIQLVTETGVIGFIVFISIIISCLRNFQNLSKNKSTGMEPLNNIAGVAYLGFIGSLTCAFFLTQAYSILFTLFFALSATLRHLSCSPEDERLPLEQ